MSTNLKNDVINNAVKDTAIASSCNSVNWMQQGWECPKCGAVMSPTTSVCVNCRGNHYNISNEKDLQEEIKKYLGQHYDCIGDYPEANYATTFVSSQKQDSETHVYNKYEDKQKISFSDEAHIREKDIGTMKGMAVNLV